MRWFEALFGKVFSNGVERELSGGINFTGGLRAVANPVTRRIDVSVDDIGSASIAPGAITPETLDNAAAAYANAAALRAVVDTLAIGRKVHTIDAVTAGDGGGASGGTSGYWEIVARGSLTDTVWGVVTAGGARAAVRRYPGNTVWAAWRGITTASANVSALLGALIASVPLGSIIQLGPGSFACVDELNINRRVTVQGAGISTELKWAAELDEETPLVRMAAKWSELRALQVTGFYQEDPTGNVCDAILVEAESTVENCFAAYATGVGFAVSADVTADGTNANGFTLRNCTVSYCRKGVWVGAYEKAGDCNSGKVVQVTAIQNREGGFLVSGGFGNTFDTCIAETNGTQGTHFSYETAGGVNACAFVNCYLEDGDVHRIRAPSLIYGGTNMFQVDPNLAVADRATYLLGRTSTPQFSPDVEAFNPNGDLSALGLSANTGTYFRAGDRTRAGSAGAIGARNTSTGVDIDGPYRWEYGRLGADITAGQAGSWWVREANLDRGAAFGWQSRTTTAGSWGYAACTKFQAWHALIGSPYNPTLVSNSPTIPTTGTWPTGTFLFQDSSNHGESRPLGWNSVGSNLADFRPVFGARSPDTTTVRGDVSATLAQGDPRVQVWTAPLTAARAVTLSTTGVYEGVEFCITRAASATGAFDLDVGGLTVLAPGEWCVVKYVAGSTNAFAIVQRGRLDAAPPFLALPSGIDVDSALCVDLGVTYSGTMRGEGTSPPAVTFTGTPLRPFSLDIVVGGARGTATFRYSTNGGATWSTAQATAATVTLTTELGVTLAFATGTYDANNVYYPLVSALADQSGEGNDVTQASDGARPAAVYWRGRRALQFFGSQNIARSTFTGGATSQPVTHFLVGQWPSTGVQTLVDGSTSRLTIYQNSPDAVSLFAGSTLDIGAPVAGEAFVIASTFDGSNSYSLIQFEGGAVRELSTVGAVGSNSRDGTVWGANNGGGGNLTGILACELVISGRMARRDLWQKFDDLRRYYGIGS